MPYGSGFVKYLKFFFWGEMRERGGGREGEEWEGEMGKGEGREGDEREMGGRERWEGERVRGLGCTYVKTYGPSGGGGVR